MPKSQGQLNSDVKIPPNPPLLRGKIKVALIHDFLLYPGGAERVLGVLSEMYPEAPIYTLLYDKEKMSGMFKGKDIRPSYLQKFPKFLRKHYQWLLPFFPVIPETFDLREYDLVISSSGAWSKGIVTKLDTIHVAYIHSPMRFVWDYNEKYLREKKIKPSFFKRFVFNYLRMWDRMAADRPDYLIANSQYTQKRIAKYYRRDSQVIYPPVNLLSSVIGHQSSNANVICHSERVPPQRDESKNLSPDLSTQFILVKRVLEMTHEKYFLVVSRLSSYKKVDIVVEAFNKLGLPLVIIGQGQQEKYLRKIAQENIKILGWQSDEVIERYYKNATAFIFPVDDDFGIAPVEAMLQGAPIIAYRKGGALEIVEEGITGEFFDAQTPEVLADGIRRFMDNKDKYDKEVIINKAREFSKERFKDELGKFIERVINIS